MDLENTKFLDGIILGSLLFAKNLNPESTINSFKDWQATADSMEIKAENRILFYFSHIKMLTTTDPDWSILKREIKIMQKLANNIQLNSSRTTAPPQPLPPFSVSSQILMNPEDENWAEISQTIEQHDEQEIDEEMDENKSVGSSEWEEVKSKVNTEDKENQSEKWASIEEEKDSESFFTENDVTLDIRITPTEESIITIPLNKEDHLEVINEDPQENIKPNKNDSKVIDSTQNFKICSKNKEKLTAKNSVKLVENTVEKITSSPKIKEFPIKICTLCGQESQELIELSACKHACHQDCLRLLIGKTLFSKTEALRCQILCCRTEVVRKDIHEVCNDEQMIFYDSCQFIEEFEKEKKVILWCPHCKRISFKEINQFNKCRYCREKVITLKSKLKYGKLILNSESEQKDTSHLRSIKNYMEFCKSK